MTPNEKVYTNRGKALECLTPKQRVYYTARYFNEWSYRLIAERYGVNVKTVFECVKRAEANLRAAGITPPVDKQAACLIQKDDGPTIRVVNLSYIDEIAG
mgnify:CR=1 FL=1